MNWLKINWNLENRNIEEYYSEPVQEIMGSVPSWITRWGVTIIFAVFAMIILGCCLIDYPQTISSPITVVVSDDGEVTGNMLVPSPGFGKVQIGQTVRVRLDCYPYMQYGLFLGEVTHIENLPQENTSKELLYSVRVSLSNALTNNQSLALQPLRIMSGTADIVVDDRQLIDLFVGPIYQLLL